MSSKQPIQDPIEKRVEMINGYFTLPGCQGHEGNS